MTGSQSRRRVSLLVSLVFASLASGAGSALLGICGPFTDVAADVFCPFVLEIFYLGITTGTTATTYDPASNVSRLQMAAFLSRTVDGALKRGSRRAALDQFWTTQNSTVMGLTTVGLDPVLRVGHGVAEAGRLVGKEPVGDAHLVQVGVGGEGEEGRLLVLPPEAPAPNLSTRLQHGHLDEFASNAPAALTRLASCNRQQRIAVDRFHKTVAQNIQRRPQRLNRLRARHPLLGPAGTPRDHSLMNDWKSSWRHC